MSVEENDVERGLPFHGPKQDALLGYLLTDPKFFLQARNLIKPHWFVDPHASAIYTTMLKWYEAHQRVPTVEEVRHSPEILKEESAVRIKLVAKVGAAIHRTEDFKFDALSEELTKWLRARIFYSGVNQAQKNFNTERYEIAYRQMDDAIKEIKEANITRDREESFANWRADFEQDALQLQNAMTFGVKTIDNLLLPENTHGSLLPGDTTILLAPTNVGKTTAMITVAIANVLRGKRVLFITHEGRPMDIKLKMRMNFLNTDRKGMWDLANHEEGINRLETSARILDRFLRYIPYNKAGLAVEDVEPIVRRKQEEMMAKNDGKGFDMLVVDYPAKLTTKRADGGHLTKRHIDEIVYGYFIQFALEYNFHSLLAIQTNREGSRVNKGQRDERRLLTMEDVHESFGVMQEATNVITMNRDPLAKVQNRLTYFIDKSRSNDTGFAVIARSNYKHAITHSDDLGCIWYRGVTTPADKVNDLLTQENSGIEIDIMQL